MTTHRRFRRAALPAALLTALAAGPAAQASGFAVPESSVAGLGTANAMVANPDEIGAFVYNPAAMAFHDQSSLAVGALMIGPDFSVRTDSGSHDSAGADWLAAPMLQAALRINDQWSVGLGVTAPFGLETRWETGTFPALTNSAPLPSPPFPAGNTIPLSPQPTASELEIVDINPTATYRVNQHLALSAGADIYWGKSAQLNSSITQLEGDGTGLGFNVSALYVKDALSLGINFHSAATVELDGTYSVLDSNLVATQFSAPSQSGELDLDLPWRLQLGIRYEVTPQLAVEVDWTRTGWSEFKEIKVIGDLNGDTIVQDTNDWSDANAYRLGATYQLTDQTQLRFGYSYDETGQEDDYFSPRIPDNDRHLFSLGVSHALQDGWQVEAGYMYVMISERDVRGSRRGP